MKQSAEFRLVKFIPNWWKSYFAVFFSLLTILTTSNKCAIHVHVSSLKFQLEATFEVFKSLFKSSINSYLWWHFSTTTFDLCRKPNNILNIRDNTDQMEIFISIFWRIMRTSKILMSTIMEFRLTYWHFYLWWWHIFFL